MDDGAEPIGQIYTADEVAAQFRITKRVLIKTARRLGACSVIGREYLFSDADIRTIWNGTRLPCNDVVEVGTPSVSSEHSQRNCRN